MPITAAEWYDRDPDLRNLEQGDVLDGIPIVYTPAQNVRWVLLRPLPKGPLENARGGLPRTFHANVDGGLPTAWNRQDGELVMGSASVYRVVILSRSCNLDWKKHIQVAPVYPVEGVDDISLRCLRDNNNAFSFYLPPDGDDMPEGYADLSQVSTVHVSYLRRTDHLVRRLTGRARTALQDVVAEYYAKPFGFNTDDAVPQRALYRCANCFFEGVPDCVAREIEMGANFPPCPLCNNDALWVKVPRDLPRLTGESVQGATSSE
ncbi:MAG TPA: hypothetical protein VNW47_09500 [Terriglobales bacterium]|jgi:hypothetical protein|nr:hypothetical protein [Terriglobales bacterium]